MEPSQRHTTWYRPSVYKYNGAGAMCTIAYFVVLHDGIFRIVGVGRSTVGEEFRRSWAWFRFGVEVVRARVVCG